MVRVIYDREDAARLACAALWLWGFTASAAPIPDSDSPLWGVETSPQGAAALNWPLELDLGNDRVLVPYPALGDRPAYRRSPAR